MNNVGSCRQVSTIISIPDLRSQEDCWGEWKNATYWNCSNLLILTENLYFTKLIKEEVSLTLQCIDLHPHFHPLQLMNVNHKILFLLSMCAIQHNYQQLKTITAILWTVSTSGSISLSWCHLGPFILWQSCDNVSVSDSGKTHSDFQWGEIALEFASWLPWTETLDKLLLEDISIDKQNVCVDYLRF